MERISLLSSNGIDVEKGLELLGDIEMYNEIMTDFLNEANNRLTELQTHKENNDMENYAILVHAIKSDSKYLGFDKLAELALAHELESKDNNIEYVNSNYDELITELNRIIKVIQTYLE
ncbi:MAG: Hpt domain-containing protein [Bacilli bacterium]|nr:Hpt domain-containing protein [Bacilli bacterium]MDD4282719.1 Hpt domain-containing protein [Bacilli bacterium]MDD4718399.1 Hpt domain-containing protein [Bacilli bacterium]